jgi:hypothetical protein
LSKVDQELENSTDPLSHVKWAAWGVIDIEKLERLQRRNYIKRARSELEAHGWALTCGGNTRSPHYAAEKGGEKISHTGPDAFMRMCSVIASAIETVKAL